MLKIELKFNQNLFVTSDTHYNHKNICRGVSNWRTQADQVPIDQTRDFNNLDHMNDTLVNNINQMVGQDDILIHLGDWSFGGFESIKEFRDRIVCKNIYLIYGNHDHHIQNNRNDIQDIFVKTMDYTILKLKFPSYGKIVGESYEFVLMHYPIASHHNMNEGVIHLHGHVHLPSHLKVGKGKSLDVGVDGNDLHPYNIKDIIKLMKNQPIKKLELPSDHHEERLKNSK